MKDRSALSLTLKYFSSFTSLCPITGLGLIWSNGPCRKVKYEGTRAAKSSIAHALPRLFTIPLAISSILDIRT